MIVIASGELEGIIGGARRDVEESNGSVDNIGGVHLVVEEHWDEQHFDILDLRHRSEPEVSRDDQWCVSLAAAVGCGARFRDIEVAALDREYLRAAQTVGVEGDVESIVERGRELSVEDGICKKSEFQKRLLRRRIIFIIQNGSRIFQERQFFLMILCMENDLAVGDMDLCRWEVGVGNGDVEALVGSETGLEAFGAVDVGSTE